MDESMAIKDIMESRSKRSEIWTLSAFSISILLISEVFSGAIRFYFNRLGIEYLIYIPKVLCLITVINSIIRSRNTNLSVLLSIITLSSIIGLYNGASFLNIGFSIYNFSPLMLGVIVGRDKYFKESYFISIVVFCLGMCVIGTLLDKFIDFPWKGFGYTLGDLKVEGNRDWTTGGLERISGFSRLSPVLSLMLGTFGIFVISNIKSKTYKIIVFILISYCIFLTTSKSSFVAFVISFFFFLFVNRKYRSFFYIVFLIIGLLLPFYSIYERSQGLSSLIKSDLGALLLASFDDRIVNTWPNFFSTVNDFNGNLIGVGFGTVGSTVNSFDIKSLHGRFGTKLAVADNTVLYLWGMFGALGLVLFGFMRNILLRLNKSGDKFSELLLSSLFCIIMISWATDVFETAVGSLFIGLSIAYSYRRAYQAY